MFSSENALDKAPYMENWQVIQGWIYYYIGLQRSQSLKKNLSKNEGFKQNQTTVHLY